MTTLNLGCADVPYTGDTAGTTTGQVAGYLESKYHPIEIFYRLNEEKIAEGLAQSVAGALESLMSGAPPSGVDAFASATSQIEADFKQFLSLAVIETLGYPGVPTQAALDGVNHRLKTGKGARRPSLIDTGLYQSSFKSWVE